MENILHGNNEQVSCGKRSVLFRRVSEAGGVAFRLIFSLQPPPPPPSQFSGCVPSASRQN